jgi:hypothetical protein
MKKFCCATFQIYYSAKKEMGLNIRIRKISGDYIQRVKAVGGKLDFDKSFMITEGYCDKLDLNVKAMAIKYCPFCGKELKKIYDSDEFVQEVVDE